jgi:hypothetical protein
MCANDHRVEIFAGIQRHRPTRREVMAWCSSIGGITVKKNLKRDYVCVHDRPDAQTVLFQLPAGIEDYNESRPRKTPQMKSLRKLMRRHHLAACPV